MSDLFDRLAALPPEKRALLKQRLMAAASTDGIASAIPRRSRASSLFPPSFAQERMWFDHHWSGEGPLYNQAVILWIKGPLDINRLVESLNWTIRRHEILRTGFAEASGAVMQSVVPEQSITIPVLEVDYVPQEEREAEARHLAIEQALKPFELARGTLLRTSVLRLGPEWNALVFVVHHIVFDGWSANIHFRELFTCYEALAHRDDQPLEDLALQYADYAAWQREQLSTPESERQSSYWEERLAGMPAALELPTDYPRPAVRDVRGLRESFVIDQALLARIKGLAREQGVTLFMMLLAGFKALIARYTGQSDIVVGTPVTGRSRKELEGLVGLFINTLVLRTRLDLEMSFAQLLESVKETTVGAYANRDFPFEKLVEQLQPERNSSRTPLFQVFFDLQKQTSLPVPPAGLDVEAERIDTGTEQFDVSFALVETASEVTCEIGYRTQLFDTPTIKRMTSHYLRLIEAALGDPYKPISTLRFMCEAERRQILAEWNDSSREYARDKCVHALFVEQAALRPDAVAVSFGEGCLTYGELDRRSNKLARHLRARGVGPEVMVGISMMRSIEWVVGLLGILKAGAAHASLDPSYPRERLASMMEDARVSVLLTESVAAEDQLESEALVIRLDADWPVIERESDEAVDSCAIAENSAYVVYTSGSTGRPKGVVTTHGSLLNLVWWHRRRFGVSPQDRASQVARMGFDASVWELWPYLTAGASLHIVDEETRYSPSSVVRWLIEKSITMGWLPPALGEGVFQDPDVDRVSMKFLLGGSDRAVIRPPACAHFQYFNPYGPTEATVIVTCSVLSPKTEDPGPIHVGCPLDNSQMYVLDGRLEPAPIGVAGEIFIGGDNLARGYLRDSQLTAAKFVPDPFSPKPGSRLYRSGDLGRFLADGRLEVIGRIDHQVKIRGFRIELGEIEQALASHAAVRESVVVVREDAPGEKKIVAYVVPETGGVAQQACVSEFQRERVLHWKLLYDQTYDNPNGADPSFNTVGWNSSYTGAAFSEPEMREWRDATVEKILSLRPRRVLEIGCGTGLLTFAIAPEVSEYYATDFSSTSLDQIRGQLVVMPALANVVLQERMADDFRDLEAGSFDAVILNSVIQYFPDIDYLVRVLNGAANLVHPGGQIFVGDVRDFRLLEALQTSIHLYRAAPDDSIAEIRSAVQKSIANEEELLVDPAFFYTMSERAPAIGGAIVNPKRGHRNNELTCFRYDVVLHVGSNAPETHEAQKFEEHNWRSEDLTVSRLGDLLAAGLPGLHISDVPNVRVLSDFRAAAIMVEEEFTVRELRERLLAQRETAVDPNEILSLAARSGYEAEIYLGAEGEACCFNVALVRSSEADGPRSIEERLKSVARAAPQVVPITPLNRYANDPLRKSLADQLTPRLREYLAAKLPDYMIPSSFVLLNALPLGPNGKVDRRALPPPDGLNPALRAGFQPCRTETEEKLAKMWAETLGVTRVGIKDNFFDLGGHSLMVAQVVSRIRDAFSMELPIAGVFERPTVAELGEYIDAILWNSGAQEPGVRIGEEIEAGEI